MSASKILRINLLHFESSVTRNTRFEVFTAVMYQVKVECCGRIPTFRRTVLPSSSG